MYDEWDYGSGGDKCNISAMQNQEDLSGKTSMLNLLVSVCTELNCGLIGSEIDISRT